MKTFLINLSVPLIVFVMLIAFAVNTAIHSGTTQASQTSTDSPAMVASPRGSNDQG